MKHTQECFSKLHENISLVIQGKSTEIRLILAAWFAGGHVLLEDVPGTGKTVLAKAIIKSCQVAFGRVQFTPDLLPADITGTSIYHEKIKEFSFSKGPIFCTFFLGDEINRATPRTQSALLEAMAEKQVTVDNKTHLLDELFFVIATQNPIEQHGTFPLPEAQLDRFMVKMSLGYPDKASEIAMMKNHNQSTPLSHLHAVVSRDDILKIRQKISLVKVSDSVYEYIQKIVAATRNHPEVDLGASPRACLALARLGQTMSLLNGDDFVRPQMIYELSPAILRHRIILNAQAKYSGRTTDQVIEAILKSVLVPTRPQSEQAS
jgi:MoxR-like ATPase